VQRTSSLLLRFGACEYRSADSEEALVEPITTFNIQHVYSNYRSTTTLDAFYSTDTQLKPDTPISIMTALSERQREDLYGQS
jgi:hypothetical protein